MQWHSESYGDYTSRVKFWHRWFAWYPVFLYDIRKTVWLETIERKYIRWNEYDGTLWDYRLIDKGE